MGERELGAKAVHLVRGSPIGAGARGDDLLTAAMAGRGI